MSQYSAYVVYTRKNCIGFNPDVSVNDFWKNVSRYSFLDANASKLWEVGEFARHTNSSSKSYMAIKFANMFTCRETMITSIYTRMKRIDEEASAFERPMVIVRYEKESGYSLSDEHKAEILKFASIFPYGLSNPFHVYSMDGYVQIAFTSSPSPLRLYQLSFLLYIFRHRSILQNILSKFANGTHQMRVLYDYLTGAFIENSDSWGDSDNSAFLLSLFCYMCKNSENFIHNTFRNGPSNACEYTVPHAVMAKYLRYFRTYLYNEDGIQWSQRNLSGGMSDSLKMSISSYYQLLILEEKEKLRQNKLEERRLKQRRLKQYG